MSDYYARRESARQRSGRFGNQNHSAPEVSLPGTVSRSGRKVRFTVKHTVALRQGLLRLQRNVTFPVEVEPTVPSAHRLMTKRAAGGRRVYKGRHYLPVRQEFEPVKATDGALITFLSGIYSKYETPTAATQHGAATQLHALVQERANGLLVIDGELWVRADPA